MITRSTAHRKHFSRREESERFAAPSDRSGVYRRRFSRSKFPLRRLNSCGKSLVQGCDSNKAARANAHSAPNVSSAGKERMRDASGRTVSFTCMRTIPRDDTVTSTRFPASSRSSSIAVAKWSFYNKNCDVPPPFRGKFHEKKLTFIWLKI